MTQNGPYGGEEHVILLHGMGMPSFMMGRSAQLLRREGYVVHNTGYPSFSKSIEDIAEDHLRPAIAAVPDTASKLHFVAHSLGSIVLRRYRALYDPPLPGRTVMLGPPNNGSEVADFFKSWDVFRWCFGPAGQSLGTTPEDMPVMLGPLNFETGVIAGEWHWMHFMTGPFMMKPNDGLVTVESTKIDGMKDHIVMPIDHSGMVFSTDVMKQAVHFLRTGAFVREVSAAAE